MLTHRHHGWTALLALALVGLPRVAGAAPLTVHAVVLADPRDEEAGQRRADSVAEIMLASGAYDLVDLDVLQGRIEEPPGALFTRCHADVSCWRDAGARGGIEQFVLVELVDSRTLGLRMVDVGATGPFRHDLGDLLHGRYVDPELVDRALFRHGALRLDIHPAGAALRLDGGEATHFEGPITLEALAAGKHAVEVEAEGFTPVFAALMVYPGQTTVLEAELSPIRVQRPRWTRWTTWAGVGIVVSGGVALGVASSARGVGVRP